MNLKDNKAPYLVLLITDLFRPFFFFLKFLALRLGRTFLLEGCLTLLFLSLLFLSLRCCAKNSLSTCERRGINSSNLSSSPSLSAFKTTDDNISLSCWFSIMLNSPLCLSSAVLEPWAPEWNWKSHLPRLLGDWDPRLGKAPRWGFRSGILTPFLGLNPSIHPLLWADWIVWNVLELILVARFLERVYSYSMIFSLKAHMIPFFSTRLSFWNIKDISDDKTSRLPTNQDKLLHQN